MEKMEPSKKFMRKYGKNLRYKFDIAKINIIYQNNYNIKELISIKLNFILDWYFWTFNIASRYLHK